MTAATYQYVDLPDAPVVTTRALLTARENIGDTVAARAMMCIHGGAGFGKTLAVNTCLRELEPGEDVRKITFRARPTARAVRYELFTALDLAGEPPRHPSEFDRLLKTALAERPRTFLVDEAQWLSGEAFEYFRYLWDEPSTQLAITFVGGEGCHTVLRREPMLSSRIFIWQHFTRLTPSEVLDVIPLFHPLWVDADPEDITFADSHAAHGNFRASAQLTAHTRTGRPRVDQELLRWAFSRSPDHHTATPMPLAAPRPIAVVIDRHDDALHTHTALAAHHPSFGRVTLHPGPGTTSGTGLAHDLLAAWENRPCSRAASRPAVSPHGKPLPPG
ncbi:AAA family ATPase [Streptomyces sp. NPDC059008]|uniref:AAA family ATPase n=1 Tax=Streptomyces sp. NPDC059008 TaxID=3346693 RepID=UPI0036B20D0D